MAQVLERMKTFFIMMTKNDEAGEIRGNNDIEEEVKAIKAQESGIIGKLENSIDKEEEGSVVKKVKVDEKSAQENAEKHVKAKTSNEKQIGE
jgi:hypothetical protein